ncbi:uncharacterized protein LOC101889912 isoform X6 [Musca domestica]|uniref:ubiquitinyl hydrolase 1 n=1 Tax=Musca domestica TaxID=7370 RepID=A0A9J7IBN6_MUSDO|nr:uncharacterized protein LOC101889912 isoform X6 [Musca domestica]
MDGCTISKYAVVNRSSKLRLHYSSDVPPEKGVGANGCSDEFTVPAGTLIKIYQWKGPVSVGSKIYSTVQVLDLISQLPIYENLYECPQANLTKVPENLWPFVISIVDPDERLRMIKNTEHCKWISYLKVNDFVSVKGEVFSNSAQRFDCIVRYIGPVRELQPVGYFFALELLHLDSGPSPQADKIPFCGVYMQCESQLAIFATANWVTPIPKDIQKKFSTREFLSETFEKFKSAIGPSSALTGGGLSRSISPKPDKKPKNKQKEASATFYDTLCDTPSSKPKEMDSKNDNSSVMTADNEEFKQTVENYERSLERRTTNTVQTQTQPQSGILKNKRTDQTKPSSVLNMGDRDIVVIDNTDIDESTRNEGEVIVLDKTRQDVDLVELLGSDWPKTAGDAAAILNKQKLQNSTLTRQSSVVGGGGACSNGSSNTGNQKHNRNKSSNPLSHIVGGNTKKMNDFSVSSNKNVDRKPQKSHKKKERGRSCASPQIPYENNITIANQPIYANTPTDDMIATDVYESPVLLPTVLDGNFSESSPLPEIPGTGLGVGSMVEVNMPDESGHLYGVIRWIGVPPGVKSIMVGIELEDDYIDKQLLTTDGGFNGISLFKCPAGRGLFVESHQCSSDRRFTAEEGADGNDVSVINNNNNYKTKQQNVIPDEPQTFGHMDCPIVPGAIAPITPRQCSVCGKLAEFECRDCFGVLQSGVGLESTSFCPKCLETVHMHVKRRKHKHRKLSVPQDFRVMADHIMTVPRLYMELFAVVCIETSHYVAFVKAGSGPDAPWCFFDSMADRKGEQNGYNIPEMITVPDLPQWLSEEGSRIVNETSSNDKMLPEHAKRLFCDAYMCMYQSTDVMMYR